MTKSYLQVCCQRVVHACAELHFALSRFTLPFGTAAPVMANKYGRLYCAIWDGSVPTWFQSAVNGLFRGSNNEVGKRACELRLDPRRWPRLEVSDFSSRVYRSRRKRDGNGASSAFSILGRNTGLTIEDYQRLSCPCRVRYFASPGRGTLLRLIHYTEKPRGSRRG